MALSDIVTMVTVTVDTILDFNDEPVTGRVTFSPSVTTLASPSDSAMVIPRLKSATLDAQGGFSVTVPATNQPDVSPTDWYYTVTLQIPGRSDRVMYLASVPYDSPGGVYDATGDLAYETPEGLASYVTEADVAAAQAAAEAHADAADAAHLASSDPHGVYASLDPRIDVVEAGLPTKQPLDADLTAYADLTTTGLVIRAADGAAVTRTIAAGSGAVTVANGGGIAGNPTIDIDESQLSGIPAASVSGLADALAGIVGPGYRIVAAPIRNVTGQSPWWEPISDAGHAPEGISSIVTTTSDITVNYTFTASRVLSLVVTTDETLSQMGLFCGASVGLSSSVIKLKRASFVDYISYNGSEWVSSTGHSTFAYAGGVLTVTHPDISGVGVSVTGRGGVYVPQAESVGTNITQIKFYDWAGVAQTTPNTNQKAFLTRTGGYNYVNPQNIYGANINLWILGVFEV